MREELRRNNSIGNRECTDKFVHLVFGEMVTGLEALYQSFRYFSIAQFNCHIAILFFEDLDLIRVSRGKITLTDRGLEISTLSDDDRMLSISSIVLTRVLENNLLNFEKIAVDSMTGELKIPANAVALSGAIYRNFLYENGCFIQNGGYLILKNKKLSDQVETQIVSEKKRMSQEELLLQLQKQQEDGDKGELFVIDYETRRLSTSAQMPRRVSLIDVSAGYDILSFEDSTSLYYDRYIEVKSYRGTPHFYWSLNEKNTAEALGNKYYIYLVDLNQLEQDVNGTYVPLIIQNPAEELKNEKWYVEANSFRISLIQ